MITIIKAEEKYLPTVLFIEQEAFSPSWMEGSLLSELDNEDACFALAVDENEVLGFCVLHQAADEAEIYQIAVRADRKRRGAGDMLMDAVLDHARKTGAVAVYLEVRKSNDAAIKLYKKHGFKSEGRRKNYYSCPVEDALVMALQFQSGNK